MVNERFGKMGYGDDAREELQKLHNTIIDNTDLEEDEKGKLIGKTDEIIGEQREASARELEEFEATDKMLFRDKFAEEQRQLRELIISLAEGIDAQLEVAGSFGVITDGEFEELYANVDALVPLNKDLGEYKYERDSAEDWRRRRVQEGRDPREMREIAEERAQGLDLVAHEPSAWESAKEQGESLINAFIKEPGSDGMANVMVSAILGEVNREVAREQYSQLGFTGEDLEIAIDLAQEPFDVILKKNFLSLVSFIAFGVIKVVTMGRSSIGKSTLPRILQSLLPERVMAAIGAEVGEDVFEEHVLNAIEDRIADSIDRERYGNDPMYLWLRAERVRRAEGGNAAEEDRARYVESLEENDPSEPPEEEEKRGIV